MSFPIKKREYFSKGFSLIEIILYITLLSFIILGIFSLLFSHIQSSINKPVFSDEDYKLLNENLYDK